ncbi:uncharacterized protein DUF4956 [Brevirhabdus pacifica]|nr:DUF4956 domain-containing protein [Brevirhabdus pacifica]PJJ86418.1 uncharacterized protein DUF4956 [Brevirhabdus pacifica]
MNPLLAELDKILQVGMLLVSSILIRQAVMFSRQTWIRSYSHTLTLILLPIITYALTSIISGNIALSLGMVGALSIVRFRNPVKSPLELVVYFLMISTGIAAAVSPAWLALLVGSAVAILVGTEVLNRWSWRFRGRPLYNVSFTEGNSLNTLEVYSEAAFEELMGRAELVSFTRGQEGNIYRFASASREDLLDLSREMDGNPQVSRVAFMSA